MNSYTHPLTQEQAAKLRALLEELGFEFSPKQYTLFFAQKNKLSVAVYEKGPKVLVQGKGVEEFVQAEDSWRSKAGLRRSTFAGNVRASFGCGRERERRFFWPASDLRRLC